MKMGFVRSNERKGGKGEAGERSENISISGYRRVLNNFIYLRLVFFFKYL